MDKHRHRDIPIYLADTASRPYGDKEYHRRYSSLWQDKART